MTYRELRNRLNELSDEYLDKSVTVYDDCEYLPVNEIAIFDDEIVEETPVLIVEDIIK